MGYGELSSIADEDARDHPEQAPTFVRRSSPAPGRTACVSSGVMVDDDQCDRCGGRRLGHRLVEQAHVVEATSLLGDRNYIYQYSESISSTLTKGMDVEAARSAGCDRVGDLGVGPLGDPIVAEPVGGPFSNRWKGTSCSRVAGTTRRGPRSDRS